MATERSAPYYRRLTQGLINIGRYLKGPAKDAWLGRGPRQAEELPESTIATTQISFADQLRRGVTSIRDEQAQEAIRLRNLLIEQDRLASIAEQDRLRRYERQQLENAERTKKIREASEERADRLKQLLIDLKAPELMDAVRKEVWREGNITEIDRTVGNKRDVGLRLKFECPTSYRGPAKCEEQGKCNGSEHRYRVTEPVYDSKASISLDVYLRVEIVDFIPAANPDPNRQEPFQLIVDTEETDGDFSDSGASRLNKPKEYRELSSEAKFCTFGQYPSTGDYSDLGEILREDSYLRAMGRRWLPADFRKYHKSIKDGLGRTKTYTDAQPCDHE